MTGPLPACFHWLLISPPRRGPACPQAGHVCGVTVLTELRDPHDPHFLAGLSPLRACWTICRKLPAVQGLPVWPLPGSESRPSPHSWASSSSGHHPGSPPAFVTGPRVTKSDPQPALGGPRPLWADARTPQLEPPSRQCPGEQGGCPSHHVKPFKQPDLWERKGTPQLHGHEALAPHHAKCTRDEQESRRDSEAAAQGARPRGRRPRGQQLRVTQQP